MKRFEDWPERLAEYLHARACVPFSWGVNDCVTFADGAVHAMTGEHVVSVTWDSEHAATAELERLGGLESAVDSVLPSMPVLMAGRGDIVLVQFGDVRWLAVCDGTHAWSAPVDGRRGMFPMHLAVRAWRVG